jgi:hypothetical protein
MPTVNSSRSTAQGPAIMARRLAPIFTPPTSMMVLLLELPADQLPRSQMGRTPLRQCRERLVLKDAVVSDDADDRPFLSCRQLRFQSQLPKPIHDVIDFLLDASGLNTMIAMSSPWFSPPATLARVPPGTSYFPACPIVTRIMRPSI